MSLSSLQGVLISGAITINDNNLTPNNLVASDAEAKIGTSSVSNIEVGYLVGANDLIQTDLNTKATQATTCSKTEVDSNLALKANQTTAYTKTGVDSNFGVKSKSSNNTY